MKQSSRGLVPRLDFRTSFGHGDGGDHRARLGIATLGPQRLITDLAVWRPDPETKEFAVVSLHPGVSRDEVRDTCGWPVRFAANPAETPPPDKRELDTLRELHARTRAAHGDRS